MALAQAVVDELRRRHIVLPPVATIERLCAEVSTRAQRQVYRLLTDPLAAQQRKALDSLLLLREGRRVSTLTWIRQSPGAPSAKAVLAHIERLQAIRAIALPIEPGRDVHQNRLIRLAREGAQTAVYPLEEYEPDRRHATLVAILLDTAATLIDETLDLHDRLIGSFFTKAKHRHEREFAAVGKAINDKVRLYARIGGALVDAKTSGTDPFVAIEAIMPWDQFAETVKDAERLARTEDFDHLVLVGQHYQQLRRYAPAFLDTFEFSAVPAAQGVIDAIQTLRTLNRTSARKVPADAPIGFVRKRWQPLVFVDGGIDRKFYELCAVAELKNSLRAGDVSVAGSRQFKDFDAYLMSRSTFDGQRETGTLAVPVADTPQAYLAERLERLRTALDEVNRLAGIISLLSGSATALGIGRVFSRPSWSAFFRQCA